MNVTKFERNKRICMLDELRGVAIIAMIIYHTLYSMAFVFKLDFSYNLLLQAHKFQPLIPILFITLCGISCSFSKSNLKRGSIVFAIAIAITIVTAIFMPSATIIFGILHFLGIALILYSLAQKFIDKVPVNIGIVLFLVLFILAYNIPRGYIGFKPLIYFELPTQLYRFYPLFILGFPTPDFISGDYFPLIPNIFLLLFGVYIGKLIKEKDVPSFMYKKLCPPLDFLGRHSLAIYVVHQPIIIGILYLVTLVFDI